MVMICQQCGDRGFPNAFIYCVQCLDYAIHRYCLDVLPETIDAFVPWVCEDCQPKVPSNTFPKHNFIRSLEEDLTSSEPSEDIHYKSKLKKNRDTDYLVDGIEQDSCQEATIVQHKHIPLEDFPLKVDLKKRKERDAASYWITKGGCVRKVITEPHQKHVMLTCSTKKLDVKQKKKKKKKKKKRSTASLLNRTEKHSCQEATGEPDRDSVPPTDTPEVNSKKRKEIDTSRLVDVKEKNSCHEGSTAVDRECVPLSELCRIAKLKKVNKKRDTDSSVAGAEQDSCHAKEPDCQHSTLADSPAKLESKKSRKETHTTVNVKDNNSCHGDMPEPEDECASAIDSASVKDRLKLKRDVAHGDTGANELKGQTVPSQQPNEVRMKHDLDEQAELADSCSSLKTKKAKLMKSDNACSVDRTEDKILRNSSNDPLQEACVNMDLKSKSVTCSGDGRKYRNDSHQNVKVDKMLDTTEHVKLVSGCPSLKIEPDKKSNDDKLTVSRKEDHRNQQPSTIHTKQVISEDKALKIEKECQLMTEEGSRPGNEVSQFAKFANNSQQDLHGNARPVVEPIWTGSFVIINKDYETFEGFVGHVSSKVRLKVFEEASLLPSLLSLEMLPKSELWPKSFHENQPSDDNIALYFFPAESKHERVFDHLVEDMMNQELAMRATLTNAELLIFASTELPRIIWRFQGKYYLWGVFKGKRVDPSPLNHGLRVPKEGNEGARPTNSANDVVVGQRNLAKTKTSDVLSPLNPSG